MAERSSGSGGPRPVLVVRGELAQQWTALQKVKEEQQEEETSGGGDERAQRSAFETMLGAQGVVARSHERTVDGLTYRAERTSEGVHLRVVGDPYEDADSEEENHPEGVGFSRGRALCRRPS